MIQLQFPRFSELDYNGYAGLEGEITYDSNLETLRVHNGLSEGGQVLITEEIKQDFYLDHSKGSFSLLNKEGRVLLDATGRYPRVLSTSNNENNGELSLKEALPPTSLGHDQYVFVLGQKEKGDGFSGLYYADLNDVNPPANETYKKIPIQGDSNKGHWKYTPSSLNPHEVAVRGITRNMDITRTSSGARIVFTPDELNYFIPTQIDFVLKGTINSPSPTPDAEYTIGSFWDGIFNPYLTFYNDISSYESNSVITFYFEGIRKLYLTGESTFYIEVSSPSSINESIFADVHVLGYYS